MKEGAKIISSKAFCPLNFHITERNLSGVLFVLFARCFLKFLLHICVVVCGSCWLF